MWKLGFLSTRIDSNIRSDTINKQLVDSGGFRKKMFMKIATINTNSHFIFRILRASVLFIVINLLYNIIIVNGTQNIASKHMHDLCEKPQNFDFPFVHILLGFHQRKIHPDFYTFVVCIRWRIRRSRNSIQNTNNSLNSSTQFTTPFRSVPRPLRNSFLFLLLLLCVQSLASVHNLVFTLLLFCQEKNVLRKVYLELCIISIYD